MISAPSLSTWMEIGRVVGDHLWQSTLFAAVVGLLTLAFRNNRAQVRNALWLAASVKFLIPFAALVAIGSHFGWRRAAPLAQNPAPFVIDMDTMSQPFSRLAAAAPPAAVSHGMASAVPILLFAIWLCGCAAILLTWWTRWWRVAVAIRDASPIQQGPELDTLRRLEAVAGITKPVALVSSNTSLEPGVFGIVNPVLLWPRSIAGHLADKHVEMILAHELSHLRRRDNLAAAIHVLVETLFWFHPLVWWLGARMVDERERACDEDVLRLGGEPQVYAESVLKVCEFYLESPIVCVAGVTGSNLKKRMERIMSNQVGETLNAWRKLFLATAVAAALAVPLVAGVLTAPRLQAQTPVGASDQPKFDAASVKINKSGDIRNLQNLDQAGGHVRVTNATLRFLILVAYHLTISEMQSISGTPNWMDSERFDIEAVAEGNPTLEQKLLMMQFLLADRFKLVLHHETHQSSVYALVLSKPGRTGSQLQRHTNNTKCVDIAAGQAPSPIVPGAPLRPACGGFMLVNGRAAAQDITMQALAIRLSSLVDRNVVDRTGLSGTFDVTMEFQMPQPGFRIGPDASASDPSGAPSIFTALPEQLGLKLEPQTGPVNVLVIDHVEEPSPN